MTVELVVEKEILFERPPIDTFLVMVNYEHGDADHSSDSTFEFKSQEHDDAHNFVEVLLAYKKFANTNWNTLCDTRRSHRAIKKWLLSEGFEEKFIDRVMNKFDLFETDVVYGIHDTYYAHIESFEIFYFDKEGRKFQMRAIEHE
jgi:hypothetical protein